MITELAVEWTILNLYWFDLSKGISSRKRIWVRRPVAASAVAELPSISKLSMNFDDRSKIDSLFIEF